MFISRMNMFKWRPLADGLMPEALGPDADEGDLTIQQCQAAYL